MEVRLLTIQNSRHIWLLVMIMIMVITILNILTIITIITTHHHHLHHQIMMVTQGSLGPARR